MNDPFEQLRDDGERSVPPDQQFVDRLHRQLTNALTSPDTDRPTVDLPDRKQSTMPEPTSPPARATQILTPYISVHDGAAALSWYAEAFGATETVRYLGNDGRLGHAEFEFAGANIMLSDAYPEMGVVAANSYEGSSCALHVEVADCDELYGRAVAAGATSLQAPADQPHGARSATIIDPFGHRWMLSQPLHQPSNPEIDAAYDDFTVVEASGQSD